MGFTNNRYQEWACTCDICNCTEVGHSGDITANNIASWTAERYKTALRTYGWSIGKFVKCPACRGVRNDV